MPFVTAAELKDIRLDYVVIGGGTAGLTVAARYEFLLHCEEHAYSIYVSDSPRTQMSLYSFLRQAFTMAQRRILTPQVPFSQVHVV